MLVRTVMKPAPATLHPGTHLADALTTLRRLRVASMPVVDDQDHLLGFVAEVDLLREPVERPCPHRIVDDVYTRTTTAVRVDADLASAAEVMTSLAAESLPVLNETGRLVGVVSRADLLDPQVVSADA